MYKLCVFAASLIAYLGTACMFAKMLSAVLFARQNPIYAVVYVLACFCEWLDFYFVCWKLELYSTLFAFSRALLSVYLHLPLIME